MPHVTNSEGMGREERLTKEDSEAGGQGCERGGEGGTESLLEAVRLGLGPEVGAEGSAPAEGQVRDDQLLRRLRDFICGSSLKEGWRG